MRFLVAIPVFNEERTLKAVLDQVRPFAPEVLVIDDGSTDRTPQLLRSERGILRVRHVDNRGYGQALITAFRFAIDRGYDWLITMDCDEQHRPEAIPDFLEAIRRDDADVVSGSRYLREFPDNSLPPPDRRAINQKVTDLLNEAVGLQITDAFCGFKACRVSALARLDITVPGYGMPVQFWVQAKLRGLCIRELPVCLIYRDANRHFGGDLDDPDARLLYYYDVLVYELGAHIRQLGLARAPCGGMHTSAEGGMPLPADPSC